MGQLLTNKFWTPMLAIDDDGMDVVIEGIEVPVSYLDNSLESIWVKDELFTFIEPFDDEIDSAYWWIVEDANGKKCKVFASDFKLVNEEKL